MFLPSYDLLYYFMLLSAVKVKTLTYQSRPVTKRLDEVRGLPPIAKNAMDGAQSLMGRRGKAQYGILPPLRAGTLSLQGEAFQKHG
jgi:hypothetical protein